MTSEAKIFPVPSDRVALFDLDGTLLGRDYQFTDDLIYPAVQSAQDAGWFVGLSSDTPFEALAVWRQRLGLNGPIVAERGAVIEAKEELFFNRAEAAVYANARAQICQTWKGMGASVWYGNPVEALRNNDRLGEPEKILVLVNILRRCGLGFHIRQVKEDGSLTISQSLTETMAAEARPSYPDFDDLVEDLNHDYGLIIVSREGLSKRTGTQRLATILQVAKFAMVGNSISDYLGKDLAIHYAVADATEGFKAVADYIADAPQTSGAVEILKKMTDAS